MAKYWTSKYGTRIDIEGLTPEQVKQVQSTAQDRGAYGSKAIELAKKLRSSAGGGGKTSTGAQGKTQGTQTDAMGNTTTVTTNPDGSTSVDQTPGGVNKALQSLIESYLTQAGGQNLSDAPQILSAGDLEKTRQDTQDALYRESTQYLDRDMAREKEDMKQELAGRGIPFDPNDADSAWNRPLATIDEKYRGLKNSALDQARIGADARMATQSGVNSQAFNAFMDRYNAPAANAASLTGAAVATSPDTTGLLGYISNMSEAELAKYGIDKDFKAKMAQIAAAGRRSGGSGGGGQEQGPIIGGNAPGFNV